MDEPKYCLPTKPYSPIDAINRYAAATGSTNYAMMASNADYNGHAGTLRWNTFHGAWQAYYTWAGLNYILNASSHYSTQRALEACKKWYDHQGRGGRLDVDLRDVPQEQLQEFLQLAPALGFITEEDQSWVTWVHRHLPEVVDYERHFHVSLQLALESKTYEEWKSKRDDVVNARIKRQ